MNIPVQQAQGIFTQRMIAAFKEKAKVTRFLQSFFPEIYSPTKLVEVGVMRDRELMAVDVERGTEGNRNSWSKAVVRDYLPPLYDEYFDLTELDLYDTLFGEKDIDEKTFARFWLSAMDRMSGLQDKIERAKEYQCSQVFETGVLTMNNGDAINFHRKAGSLVAYSAGINWNDSNVDPYQTIGNACDWLRQNALITDGVFNVLLGKEALYAFLNHPKVLARNDLKQVKWDDLSVPRPYGSGAKLHGEVTVGEHRARLFSYPQYYEQSNGTKVKYWPDKKVVVLPEVTNFVMAHAAVPQLLTGGQRMLQQGPYLPYDFMDYRKAKHDMGLKSAPVAVPVAVDEMYTFQPISDDAS